MVSLEQVEELIRINPLYRIMQVFVILMLVYTVTGINPLYRIMQDGLLWTHCSTIWYQSLI